MKSSPAVLRRTRPHSAALGVVFILTASLSCSDPVPPAVSVESIALSLDSIAIQFRDSASELTASPKGALGVDIDAEVSWLSNNPDVVTVVPNGKTTRLIPVRPGTAEVEASSENVIATAKVVVLDTVFSVQINPADTMVTMSRSLTLTAAVTGPPTAQLSVTWRVADTAKARVDSFRLASNTAFVTSRDTGRTEVIATSAADRLKTARIPFRTARPISLYFEAQPGAATAPIRAQDVLIPGPIVKVRDALGNTFPGTTPITIGIAPGTGASNAELFGTILVATASGDARFADIGIDLPGTDYRLVASSPGLQAATSAAFVVGPECTGIPYTLGTTVSRTLTSSACQFGEGQYYDRYIVSSPVQQIFIARVTAPLRNGAVFPNGIRIGAQSDTIPYLVPAGTHSIRVQSSAAGVTGDYQLVARAPNLGKVTIGNPGVTCYRIQTQTGIVFQEELRCSGTAALIQYPCGAGNTSLSPYRLHLKPGTGATITVSSTTFDPCLELGTESGNTFTRVAVDDDGGGGTTARLRIDPAPSGRNFIVNVTARPPVPAFSIFTISIQP
jgi:hypothetical protein